MRFVKLNEEEYLNFQQSHPCGNFLNSLEAINMRHKNNIEVELVGMKDDNNQILAATILAYLKGKISYAVAQRGFLMDYHNQELLHQFTNELKNYLKEKGMTFLQISPHLLYKERDNRGDLVENGFDNSYIINNLLKEGYIHRGFTIGIPAGTEVRWEYSLYLNQFNNDEKLLLNHFEKRTRNHITKGIRYGVKVRELKKDELNLFIEMEEKTAKLKGFENEMREASYYENIYDCYGDHALFLLAYINVDESLELLKKERIEIDNKHQKLLDKIHEHPEYKNLINQEKDIQKDIIANQRYQDELIRLSKEVGKEIPISSGVFLVYPYEYTSLASGTNREFSLFDGANALRFYTMKDAMSKGIDRYNFYGISGNFSKDAPDYGVFQYKRGYGGVVEENVGEFFLPIQPMKYKLYRLLRPWKD